jgi:hypothetical protein
MLISTRTTVLAAALLGAGVLFAAVPAQATAGAAVGSCFYVDNYTAGTLGDCWHLDDTFSESGVSIWNSAVGHGTVLGTGQAGEVFYATGFSSGDTFTCDNGVKAVYWYTGTDEATGVSGAVPDCYLDQGPTG